MDTRTTQQRRQAPVLRDIVEEHFDELDFLWELRESVLYAPDWTLADLAELEERAEAHLDGLRLSGEAAIEIATKLLADERPFAVFSGARTLLEFPTKEVHECLLDALETTRGPALDGLRLALRFGSLTEIEPQLTSLLDRKDPELELAIVDALSFQRRPVRRLSATQYPTAAAAALAWRVRGRQRERIREPEVSAALASDSHAVRRSVLEAAASVSMAGLLELCRAGALHASPTDTERIEFLGVIGTTEDSKALTSLVGRGGAIAIAALRALGASGRVDGMDAILSALADPKLASAASAAFVRIAGAPNLLQTTGLQDRGRSADDSDEPTPVVVTPDIARQYWKSHQDRFRPDTRWQAALDVGPSGLPTCLDLLPLETRRDLWLGSFALSPQTFEDIELEQLARRQRGSK